MEFGCGGVGMRTSDGSVVNLYFWHIERERGRAVRREDYIGRADALGSKQEILRRMATYNRRIGEVLARHTARLERQLSRIEKASRANPAVS